MSYEKIGIGCLYNSINVISWYEWEMIWDKIRHLICYENDCLGKTASVIIFHSQPTSRDFTVVYIISDRNEMKNSYVVLWVALTALTKVMDSTGGLHMEPTIFVNVVALVGKCQHKNYSIRPTKFVIFHFHTDYVL